MDDYPVENWTPPEKFWDDPVARQIKWTPCSTELEKDPPRVFVEQSSSRLEFRAAGNALVTYGCGILCFFFLIFIPGLLFLGWFWINPAAALIEKVVFFGMGFVFVLLSYFAIPFFIRKFFYLRQPIYFDLNEGYFITKDKESDRARRKRFRKAFKRANGVPQGPPTLETFGSHQGRTEQIHALQLLPHDRDTELNLVFASGNRINLLHHIGNSQLRLTAETLSEFLGVPLWDDSERGYWHFESQMDLEVMWHASKPPEFKDPASIGSWVWQPTKS